ncbi:MAG: nuclear transport factor 2 family protein [Actinomycetota bacterium]
MAHANEDLVRRGYEAFATGDMATVASLFADDVVWHSPGRSAISGDFKGQDEVFAFFGKLVEMTGGNFGIEVHDVLANDEHAAVMVHAKGQRDGASWEGNIVHVLHLEGGKVKEIWVHEGDQYAADVFWA